MKRNHAQVYDDNLDHVFTIGILIVKIHIERKKFLENTAGQSPDPDSNEMGDS